MAMVMVQVSTDDAPELASLIEYRRERGLDRHDEWWEGVYRVVTNPSPEHQMLVMDIATLLSQRIDRSVRRVVAGINVGVDKQDARVPDVAIFRLDTTRTSRAFLTTAELVVEVLSPGERPGAKLAFYAAWHVGEYIEIDRDRCTVIMLRNVDGTWEPTDHSEQFGVTIEDVAALL